MGQDSKCQMPVTEAWDLERSSHVWGMQEMQREGSDHFVPGGLSRVWASVCRSLFYVYVIWVSMCVSGC